LNVAERLFENRTPALFTVFLDTPRWLSGAASPADTESFEAVDQAVYAYLDLLDQRLERLRRSLRAGETLAIVFAPAGGAGGGGPEVATLFLFGERVAPETAEARPVSGADVSRTLFYLSGIRLAEDIRGEVLWPLLVPGARENFPASAVRTYRGIEMKKPVDPGAAEPAAS
jgi:hypothetical protein